MASTGLPSAAERVLLEPFRGQIPERVFTHAFGLPQNKPYGRNRDALLKADALLEAAGWVVKDFKRVNEETGERFTLEFLISSVTVQRTLMSYVENLERLGIAAKLRKVEINQMVNRRRRYDFEVTMGQIWLSDIPVAPWMRAYFLSRNADRHNMVNWAGIKEPAVDFLVEKVLAAASEEEMNIAGRALDRILLWKFYIAPVGYPKGRNFVYWDRFGSPPPQNMKWDGWPHLWWLDKEKSARVDAGIAALKKE